METTLEDHISKAVEEAVAKAAAPYWKQSPKKRRRFCAKNHSLPQRNLILPNLLAATALGRFPTTVKRAAGSMGQQGHKGTRLEIP